MAAAAIGAAFPMDTVTAEKEIFQLVSSSDLSELTSAKVRKHLQEQFGLNFDPYKSRVNDMTRNAIEKMNSQKAQKRRKEKSDESSDSDSDDDNSVKHVQSKTDIDEIPQKRTSPSSDSDSDPGVLSTDRIMPKKKASRAKKATNEFNDLATTIKSTRRAAASKAIKNLRKTGSSRSSKPSNPNEDNSGKFGRMTKLCYISPELQTLVGNKYMKRCDVVKKIWDYIKEKELKDPKDRQFVLCDQVLELIFKKKRFKAFGMAKYLTRHVINTSDMDVEYQEEAKLEMERLRKEWLIRKEQKEREEREKEKLEEEEEKEKESNDEPFEKRQKLDEISKTADDDDDDVANNDEDSDSD